MTEWFYRVWVCKPGILISHNRKYMIIKETCIPPFILFTLLIVLSRTVFSAESVSPMKMLNDFYYLYLSESAKDNSALVKKYVLNHVIQSITHSSLCNYDSEDSIQFDNLEKMCAKKRECSDSKGYYKCNWDGVWVETDVNYFTKSQDVYPSWGKNINIQLLRQHGSSEDYIVALGKVPEPVMTLKVTLTSVGGAWKISSVEKY